MAVAICRNSQENGKAVMVLFTRARKTARPVLPLGSGHDGFAVCC